MRKVILVAALVAPIAGWVAGVSLGAGSASAETNLVAYTEQQAERGQALFRRNCQFCHYTGSANVKTPDQPLRGFDVGASRVAINLGGRYIRKYPSVYHLFVRIRDAMPAWDVESVTPAQKLDIVAYLLKENGFAPGQAELTPDVDSLRRMRLADPPKAEDEAGFSPLFNGRDFTGIKFLFGFNCTPQPTGCGKTTPLSFRVQDGMIIGHGREHGYWYADGKYLNFDLRLEYRWEPPPDRELGDEFFTNGSSGYLLFVTEHRVWPRTIEIEGDNEGIMRANGMAATIKATYDTAAVQRANKGAGYWNNVRIVSTGGTVEAYLNGTLTTRISEHPFKEPGNLVFQYQGGTIMWRNIRIKELTK